jgi:ZIP family zinc transporter
MYSIIPIVLSFIAGSATGIGGLFVIIFGDVNDKIVGFFMGFAGGVMLIVSFLHLYNEALQIISTVNTVIAFAFGTILMMIMDLTLPHIELGFWEEGVIDRDLFNRGIIIALGMSLHNLPEGIVISTGFTHLPELGILVAIMICLHNIPEGIATVTPLLRAGANKWRALGLSILSGIVEPIGAIIGMIVIQALGGSNLIIGWGLAFAAGVMTYVTIDELIPVAHQYCSLNHKHIISTGLLLGMLFAQTLSLVISV